MEQRVNMTLHIDAADLVVCTRRFMALYARYLYIWLYNLMVV